MSSNPLDHDASVPALKADVAANPSDEDVVRTLVEIEKSSTGEPAGPSPVPQVPAPQLPWISQYQNAGSWVLIAVVIMLSFAAAFVMKRAFSPLMGMQQKYGRHKEASSRSGSKVVYDSASQKQAEELLQRLAAGDSSAADKISQNAGSWLGKITRTNKTDQFVTAAINLADLHSREAALEAELALDGIAQNETGLRFLTNAVGDRSRRVWALWLLGALGNRGVDPVHTAKVVESYLTDPDVNVRASAVNGLSLIGTDETIPLLLDRFRNDPSPVVQERAACGIAESGMYTKPQRLQAAASLINWLDDPLLTGQQRGWDMQALGDISGQHLGADSAAWRSWYESASH
jgi:hypothetical protein